MIRAALWLWLGPVLFFWSWFALSFFDVAPHSIFLSRALHDKVFCIYGEFLGVDPVAIPPMVAKAVIFDGFLVAGLCVVRKRRDIMAFLSDRRRARQDAATSGNAQSLSSAP